MDVKPIEIEKGKIYVIQMTNPYPSGQLQKRFKEFSKSAKEMEVEFLLLPYGFELVLGKEVVDENEGE